MLGKKSVSLSGIIVASTFGWNGNVPLKHPLIGGIITPRCIKNGQEQKTRVNFDVLINDMSDKGYKICRCVVFSSLQADPGKSFAERIARQIAPGRYVEITADENTNTVPLANNDGSAVLLNGVQATRDYTSYVVNPGGIRIYNRDSVDTQKHMANHFLKARQVQANAWDYFWRPLSISYDPATNMVSEMSDADKAILEATNKLRNQLPLMSGMVSYGFAKVVLPEGAQAVLGSNAQYSQWLQGYIATGVLGADGLPAIAPTVPAPAMAGTATVAHPATAAAPAEMTIPGMVATAVDTAPAGVATVNPIVTGMPLATAGAAAAAGGDVPLV